LIASRLPAGRLLLALCLASITALAAAPPDWVEVSAANKFSLTAPAGTTFARTPGVDSFTGVFNAPGFAVHADYGAHVDPLARSAHRTQYLAREIVVDGKPAKLVTARNRGAPGYFIGMYVPQVRASAVGPIGLTLTCNVADERDYATLESVYRSLRFR
jgi:hypothetical protein